MWEPLTYSLGYKRHLANFALRKECRAERRAQSAREGYSPELEPEPGCRSISLAG
jgi:hypothetical protein